MEGDLKKLPRPSPDKELWKINLELSFRKFPVRSENYNRYKSSRKKAILDHLPIRLDIENVSRCNYRCQMCQVSGWPGLRRANDMPFEDYKRLIDDQRGLIEIKIQGMGEPLIGKDYFKMIDYARRQLIWVRSATNGSLLHQNDNYKRLVDSDICEIQISVDGATEKTYEKIRVNGDFKRVVDNCIRLNEYCRNVNRPRTRMYVVIQKNNFRELEKFPRLAADLGFDRVTFTVNLSDWGQDDWRRKNEKITMNGKLDLSIADRIIAVGTESKVEVTFWFVNEKYNAGDLSTICPWPFERAFISSDMRIVPCCMIANPAVFDLGDAHNLSKEWNGINMISFRERHLTGDIPLPCRSCYNDRQEER